MEILFIEEEWKEIQFRYSEIEKLKQKNSKLFEEFEKLNMLLYLTQKKYSLMRECENAQNKLRKEIKWKRLQKTIETIKLYEKTA
jgi:hypothetical protein